MGTLRKFEGFFAGGFFAGPGTELNSISSGAAFRRGSEEPRAGDMPRLFGSKKFVASIEGNSFPPPLPDGFCFVRSWDILSPVGPIASLNGIFNLLVGTKLDDELLVRTDSTVQLGDESLHLETGENSTHLIGDPVGERLIDRLGHDALGVARHADTVSTRAASNAARNWT